MANTTFATGDAETQKLWSAILYREVMDDFFYAKFTGDSSDSIIQTKNDLLKSKGDLITVILRMNLSEEGQSSSTTGITLEGNEEALVTYTDSVTITVYGHAVRAGSKLDLQRPPFDLRTEMKNGLRDWMTDRLEVLISTALSTTPSANRSINTGGPTTGEVLSTAFISQAKRLARVPTGGAPKIRPIRIDGKKYYVMLVHDYQTKDLKIEDAWVKAQREIGPRDLSNPIFSGMLGIWDGVVLHEYDRVALSTGSVARALLLGAQAGILGWAQMPTWYEELFDYERIPGVAVDFMAGIKKTVFNAEDFGVITLDTLYTEDVAT